MVRQNRYPKSYLIRRPLVFLCGPYCSDDDLKDRRNILRRYIGKLNYEKISPFPLIVDNLLEDDVIKEHANFTLIEEIISECSYKTYIFLDTMSTSLELGLFSSSYSKNKITALLPKDKQYFEPSIGFFVDKTITDSSNIEGVYYKNKRYNKLLNESNIMLKNIIGFKNNKLPLEIKNKVTNDLNLLENSSVFNVEFVTNDINNKKIHVVNNEEGITFTLPIFYLLILTNKYMNSNDIIQKIKIEITSVYFSQENLNLKDVKCKYYSSLITHRPYQISIDTYLSNKVEEVIENIKYFIMAIRNRNSQQRYKNLDYEGYNMIYQSPFSINELLNFDEEDKKIVKRFCSNVGKFTSQKFLVINGKKRKILMYRNNKEGYQLREIHNKLICNLEKYVRLNKYCYAYQKNKSVKQCCEVHLRNRFFLKVDIKNFFGSISMKKLEQVLKCHFSTNPELAYDRIIAKESSKSIENFYIKNWEEIHFILKSFYVNNRLPLGFSISPFVSNIFLNLFDKRIVENFPDLTYSRYADDILISSPNPFDYSMVEETITQELHYLKLEINTRKLNHFSLNEMGDHVRFLGINIIRKEDTNILSVGKKYIRKLVLGISDPSIDDGEKEKIKGKIEYVKSISDLDYEYLIKYLYFKTGLNLEDFD